jgi:cation-transporting P-type ATPase E
MAAITGLSSEEVAERRRLGLVNLSPTRAWEDYAVIASRHIFTVFNLVVVPTAIALFYYGEWRAGISVTGTALANTLIGLYQEVRAKRQLDRLAILTARKCRVVRDSLNQEILADDVVQDDLILLQAGEAVVADGSVAEANYLEIDEALLTGESDPVRRHPGDRLLSGSICVTGEGAYKAEKVGAQAFAQSIAHDARRYQYTTSPLTRAVQRIVTILSLISLLLVFLFAGLRFTEVITTERFFLMTAATIVSMIPQGLVLTATVAFTIGAVVIGKRGALVQRLNAVEAIAAVDVICTDKTGTLTTNRLKLDTLWPLDSTVSMDELLRKLAMFASATIDRDNKNIQALQSALGEVPTVVLDQIPFNSRTRFSAVRLQVDQAVVSLILGAPEELDNAFSNGHPDLLRLQSAGLRVLLFAEGDSQPFQDGAIPRPLRPLALVALADELRPEASAVLRALSEQGIAFKVISGDNPLTVRATIAPLNLSISHEEVVSGKELQAAADLGDLVRRSSVFGRVDPQQKLAIVEALQAGGSNVAMIGDGVNDLLPIKKADLGIAMGEGSAAAKSVSSLVLQNNNFAILPEAIEEGRTILRNLRRAGKLFLTKNVYSLVFILVYAVGIFDLPFPYLPQQVSLLNWMVIGIPALLIALTRERSLDPPRGSYLSEVGGFALVTGILFAIAGVTILVLAKHHWLVDERTQRTMLLTMLILLGMTVLWRIFAGPGPRLAGDRSMLLASLIIVPAYLIAMYWPFSNDFFQLTALNGQDWLRVLMVTVTTYALCLVADYLQWSKPKPPILT